MPEFVHLHNHTHYSLLDSIGTPAQLIDSAIENEQDAIAITDHGVMFGCYEFYKTAHKKGVKPIIGFEAYVANGSRFDTSSGKTKTKKKNYFHLVLLAKDLSGYKNLMKLTTLAHTEGFYYKPRIDRELIEKYHEGIIALSACIAGVVNAHIVSDEIDSAYEAAQFYKDVFGDDFYIELQNHKLPEDQRILTYAPKIASDLGLKVVATNDIHYIKSDHAIAHNVLLYIRDTTAATAGQADIYNLRYRTPEMYFKSTVQMKELFIDFPEAIETTVEIADKCNVTFEKKLYMPQFPIPKESKATSLDEYLIELTYQGINERFPEPSQEVLDRVKYELDVIISMKFPGYFLIVQDFINAAKRLGVRVGPGRGSAAGSLVAYALGITNVNPLPYDLLFERFLNPERVSMPDIDIDFADDKREKVIEYVKTKYGEHSVAQIITFGKLLSRAVLTDVGRVLGVELSRIKEITAKITVDQGKVMGLKDVVELPDLKWVKDSPDQKITELINYSMLLEGVIRNSSTHAAGVVIAPDDIWNFVPVFQPSKSKNQSVEIATQYSMNDLEDAGLLKMDFLGLRTLSIIENTLEMIQKNHNTVVDIDKIDFHDEDTYKMLSNGDTLAIFQFESGGMKEYLKQLKPHTLEEITAMNALYRPGPMDNIPEYIDRKHGRKPITYLHPIMEQSLKNTYGIIVYQEQVMQLARDIAGFSLGQADILRRAMGKKKKEEMDKLQPQFIESAKTKGIDEEISLEIFNLILKFASYGFNKSHSLAYSYLAYQTAWLKTHYPAEFLAANMTAELNDQDKIFALTEECKKFNITVLPPDVNRSDATFTAESDLIFYGLAGIKNVGIPAVESIKTARIEKKFTSLFDFICRVDTRLINKRVLEALICAGAFDSMKNGHRASLIASVEIALEYAKSRNNSSTTNIDSLFGTTDENNNTSTDEPSLINVPEWTDKQRLEKEKEVLNFYVSGNPIDSYRPYIESLSTFKIADKESHQMLRQAAAAQKNVRDPKKRGTQVRLCGIITNIKRAYDRNKNQIAFVQIEDFSGKCEVVFWSDAYSRFGAMLEDDAVLVFVGKAEMQEDNLKIYADEVMKPAIAANKFAKGFSISIDLEKFPTKFINDFKKICNDNKSKSTIIFNCTNPKSQSRSRYVAYDVPLAITESTINSAMQFFGKDKVKLLEQV